ncbi:pseudouridine synthase [Actinomycetospora termitidis]|uniref:RNA pseudouridylate synthase n=1 Tax=Actinomycetospora termitidis TaxID=3053470 RepID=A0ABT7MCX0_9PSEU|nr:pseudouridine synthase [Actinomycetospora sp. Odt1-22]MDL5158526.1 pseudouridine synthase [Actinomycetospora sp. Odt1-22]
MGCVRPPPSLPPRFGLDPARMRLPVSDEWATVRDHVVGRVPLSPAQVDAMFAAGRFHDQHGPLPIDAPYVSGGSVWFHRDLPDEAPVPFAVEVAFREDRVLVADKPHFLATIPRGRHVRETALVRLRDEHGLPDLSPAHRLDRPTAGVVLFVIAREDRGTYQNLFRDRRVSKTYEAIAPYRPDLGTPQVVRSRIVKERGIVTAREVDGEPNAETLVEVLEYRDDPALGAIARYRLTPHTGRTHQLRLHLCSLGVPILGDTFYPRVRDVGLDDFRAPLQLLARTLSWPDPRTDEPVTVHSRRRLQAWDDPAGWAAGP